MKKAFLDQLFLGFILLMGVVTFVATVSDEMANRNKIFDLKQLTLKTAQAMARSYENSMDMCYGKTIAENILKESSLGKELLKLKENSQITFSYDYYDLTPTKRDGSVGDKQPDTVIVTITGYKQDTFWYRFFDKDSFTIGKITAQEKVDTPKDVTIRYGERPTAGYQNIMGTYQLDNNNCVTNMRTYMANSKDWTKWEQLTDPKDANSPRIPIADGIESPPTYIFSVADGNRQFNNPKDNAPITLESPHCFNDGSYPKITINNITKQAKVGDASSANVFFEHDELNADEHNHFHIIPHTILSDYKNYKNKIYNANGNEKDKYEAFLTYCKGVNTDLNPNNDIGFGYESSCTEDPHNEYHYALEDLDARESDFDFTDMILNTTRLVKENSADDYSVGKDHKIIFDSGYCENRTNIPPTVVLSGCPITIQEDTSTNAISWIANDTDGTIVSKEVSTNLGSAIININGTITYTPDRNEYGKDIITMVVKDNDDALAKEECEVTIIEVNDEPTITGTPLRIIAINQLYNFEPIAEDVDGDVLTFSIKNKPKWALFDSKTGQLTGTPTSSDSGLYENILISVSDRRGGVASLPAFTIEVEDGNEGPKKGDDIPDGTIQEGKQFSYNAAPHFSDGDGDTLIYSITAKLNGSYINWFTISANGFINSIKIPKGYVGKVIEVTVKVSDGKESIRDTFYLTITNATDFQIVFHTFDKDIQGWKELNSTVSWKRYKKDGKLKIKAEKTRKSAQAYQEFNFGPSYANKKLKIEFDLYYSGGWDSSGNSQDFFAVAQGTKIIEGWNSYKNKNNTDGPIHFDIKTASTDGNGKILLQFVIFVTDKKETIYIDNVKISLQ